MKSLILTTIFCSISFAAMANEAAFQKKVPQVEQYNYGMKLDIVKVISRDPIPNVCDVVPVRMKYLDSNADTHVVEYLVLGEGCTN